MVALDDLVKAVLVIIRESHARLEESGKTGLQAHLFLLGDTLQTFRDDVTRNHGACVSWGCLFGEIPDPPAWLKPFPWEE